MKMHLAQNATNIFQIAKQIPTVDVARRFLPGLDLRRRGNRWVARCPFHEERTPSFYVFSDGGWKCFGCQAHGDSVDLVARALGLRPLEAARAIAREFGLPVRSGRPDPKAWRKAQENARRRQLERAFRRWCNDTYFGLCVLYRALGRVVAREGGYLRHPHLAHLEPYLEYLLDVLQYGPREAQIQLYKSHQLEGWQRR